MIESCVWRRLCRPEVGIPNSISDLIAREEWLKGDFLTSVRMGPTLFIASDYGGAHKGAVYETLSFLMADLTYVWLFDELRTKLRNEAVLKSRRMAYKSLGDRRRQEALVPFLRSGNTIPGLLMNIVLDKNASQLLSESYQPKFAFGELSHWCKGSFEKLTRVGQLGAMLVEGMCAPGQNVLWISDEDEIAPNREKLFEATNVLGHYLNHFCSNQMGHMRFGTTNVDNGNLRIEDLVALVDLAAGCLSEIFTQTMKLFGSPASKILIPGTHSSSKKARIIANWMAQGNHPLKKLIVLVEAQNNSYITKVVNFYPEGTTNIFDWVADFEELLRN